MSQQRGKAMETLLDVFLEVMKEEAKVESEILGSIDSPGASCPSLARLPCGQRIPVTTCIESQGQVLGFRLRERNSRADSRARHQVWRVTVAAAQFS